ncbi:DAK2 domain-containing protein [Anaerotalea alkaliphila]|uniref:DegV family EDD domain-containing protein n=1 Tax=Anaerotalea alkaliphila TaxID=2662126 RepID=A0A7X5HXB3_9FIRM|nr:DegV family protein [Anaerotalea alkaliphila]NDL68383.1 DegV family EDD domain-containing protein [Anaerotalea alkaliphila]
MTVTTLSSKDLYHAFVSGAHAVINQRQPLNRINVFPVPDGDTGTNLASTMHAIIHKSVLHENAAKTFQSIADAALSGARGNSGTIFAQYLNGITQELEEQEELELSAFSASVRSAVPHAYHAISNPVEGTMLTVIKDWADAVYAYAREVHDLVEVLRRALEDARESLRTTPEKLAVLKAKSVVDSGAKGFVHFLEGFLDFLQSGVAVAEEEDLAPDLTEDLTDEGFDLTYRYCTEAFLTGEGMPLDQVKEELLPFGDSLIVAGGPRQMKVHIHTDTPIPVFARLRRHGAILEQKVDDMERQRQVVNHRKYDIALVTDSIADIPQEILDNYQVHQVPLLVSMEGSSYLDKRTIDSPTFYQVVEGLTEYPTSSQPTNRQVEDLFAFLSTHYKSILAITVAGALSGTYNTFVQAAGKFADGEVPIDVIDSRLNSGAEGLLVLKAAEAIDQGQSHREVVDLVRSMIPRTKIYVSVSTLKYMVLGGRVSPMKGRLAKVLNVKPIVSLDGEGKGVAFGKAYSDRANAKKIRQVVQEILERDGILEYSLVHGSAPEKAARFEEMFTELIGKPPRFVAEVSTIIAMSAGKDCVAISLLTP